MTAPDGVRGPEAAPTPARRGARLPSATQAPTPWKLGLRGIGGQLSIILPVLLWTTSTRHRPLFSGDSLVLLLLAAIALSAICQRLCARWMPEVTYRRYRWASAAAIRWRAGLGAAAAGPDGE